MTHEGVQSAIDSLEDETVDNGDFTIHLFMEILDNILASSGPEVAPQTTIKAIDAQMFKGNKIITSRETNLSVFNPKEPAGKSSRRKSSMGKATSEGNNEEQDGSDE